MQINLATSSLCDEEEKENKMLIYQKELHLNRHKSLKIEKQNGQRYARFLYKNI